MYLKDNLKRLITIIIFLISLNVLAKRAVPAQVLPIEDNGIIYKTVPYKAIKSAIKKHGLGRASSP